MRRDWVEPVMPVPYVPTLGPAHPGAPLADLFDAVVEAAGTDRFLPHDKDRRWSDRKAEQVRVGAIQYHRRQTLVPTLVDRGARTVRVHAYTSAPESLAAASDLARQLSRGCGAGVTGAFVFPELTECLVYFLRKDTPNEGLRRDLVAARPDRKICLRGRRARPVRLSSWLRLILMPYPV
ncbi:hypothetical protein OHB41_48470 [Streptomyces sp. NBC_01571]|uniref:hypothetical protein n=1 Tax=Streptomyces sp. NBC_01571 TaxID=2975883 RepID=UPI00224D2F74|nr:hypothetical protein [Streptomyces sp. NBC_01571]MCX4580815.1 hypothetical protein [Streptomyces sp. NBC_01571]